MATCYRCSIHPRSRCAICHGTGTFTAPAITQAELDAMDFGPMSAALATRCASAIRRLTGYDATIQLLPHSNPESVNTYAAVVRTHTGYTLALTTVDHTREFCGTVEQIGVDR